MELPQKHGAVQVCTELGKCQSLILLLEGSRENSCVRCDHVNNLFGLVAELEEEGERLGSVGDSEKESQSLVELYSSIPWTNTSAIHITRRNGSSVLSPPGRSGHQRWRGIEMRFCLGWQANPLLPRCPYTIGVGL